MNWDDERHARAGLAALTTNANPDYAALVASHGAHEVWRTLRGPASRSGLAERGRSIDTQAIRRATAAHRARFLIPGDDEWPPGLDDLERAGVGQMGGPPFGLWVTGEGDLAALCERSVAMVGSRACTSYGSLVATDMSFELAQRGYAVISGGAYGIDLQSHLGALATEGVTVAVLANGIDDLYPRGNRSALTQVRERGLIVTELAPGSSPTKPGFLARNRIIAALAQGVVIVEAAARSGARNTASWASALARPLMAVPGPVTSSGTETPHRLIRDGEAVLVTSAADVHALLGPLGAAQEPLLADEERPLDCLDPTELAVRESLPGRGTRSAGEISVITGIDLPTCLATLGKLDLMGLVASTADGRWKLHRAAS